MRLYSVILIGAIFYLSGCASNSTNSVAVGNKDVQIKNLNGAKYLGDKIWQDSRVNRSTKMGLYDASNYCSNLTLLDVKGWTLPTVSDVESIKNNFGKFSYGKQGSPYHTSDLSCVSLSDTSNPIRALLNPLKAVTQGFENANNGKRCKYYITSINHVKYSERRGSALVRCVLDPDKYRRQENIKQNHAEQYRNGKTYADYLQAFIISKDLKDAKKAYALADSRRKKLLVEEYLVKSMAADRLVDVTIVGRGGSKLNSSRGDALTIISYAIAKKNISINTRVHSDFLEYGKYRVTVEYTVKIPYKTTVKYFITATSTETRTGEKRETYILSRNNHYTSKKTISFNNITAGIKMGMGSVEIVEGTTITARVVEIRGIE